MQLNFVSRWLNVVVNVGDTHECEQVAYISNTGSDLDVADTLDAGSADDTKWFEERGRFGFGSCGG